MSESISRRGFIAGAAAAGALAVGASGAVADEARTSVPETWDYECDFLVVGYGGAGLWGCLCGADECGMNVVALEKAPERGGGNTSINMGEFTVVNDKDGFVQYMQGFSKGMIPEAICRAWAEEGFAQRRVHEPLWNRSRGPGRVHGVWVYPLVRVSSVRPQSARRLVYVYLPL